MGRPKKHIAVQKEFGFISEVPEAIDPPPHNLEFEKSLKKSIEALNSYPAKSMIQKDNPVINEALAQELQINIQNTSIPGAPLTSGLVTNNYPYLGDPPGSCGMIGGTIGPNPYMGTSGGSYTPPNPKSVPPKQLTRNQYGLYNHIDYVFNEEGFVNWRAMIPVRYLYVGDNIKENPVRRELFTKKYGKKPEEINLATDKIEDKDLLITLAGIRFVATLRGYDSVEFRTLPSSNQGFAVVECVIGWVANFEMSHKQEYGLTFGAVACASPETTNGGFKNYLPEIASNRAFCRAVRNFLNIDVVSDEEAFEKKDDPKAPASNGVTPYGDPKEMLKAKLDEKGISFEQLKASMIKKDKEWEKYAAIIEVPSIKIFDVLGRLKQKEEKEKNPVPE